MLEIIYQPTNTEKSKYWSPPIAKPFLIKKNSFLNEYILQIYELVENKLI